MSEELGYIQNALERIEGKLDDGLMNHEGRLSNVEGSISTSRWIIGIILTVMALVISGVALR